MSASTAATGLPAQEHVRLQILNLYFIYIAYSMMLFLIYSKQELSGSNGTVLYKCIIECRNQILITNLSSVDMTCCCVHSLNKSCWE